MSHNRPINELLNPNIKDFRSFYDKEFSGMSTIPTSCEELESVRERLIQTIGKDLTQSERQFLLSFKKGIPDWDLFPLPHAKELPGIKWKLANIAKMPFPKHKEAIARLEKVLENF